MYRSVSFILACTVVLSSDNIFIKKTEAQLYGQWTQWTAFGPCSDTCGSGFTQRTRTCIGGQGQCPGLNHDSQVCNPYPCPAYVWTPWTQWTACSLTCSGGRQIRTRTCPAGLGVCPGLPQEDRVCNAGPCHIGNWNQWTAWTACSRTCAGGDQFRSRVCVGGFGVNSCPGLPREQRLCNPQLCHIGNWNQWVPWTACSATCGGGNQYRVRTCVGGAGANACPGLNQEQRLCNAAVCPARLYAPAGRYGGPVYYGPGYKGQWAQWTPWTVCSAPCGPGHQVRSRGCIGGGAGLGRSCPGLPNQQRACNQGLCG